MERLVKKMACVVMLMGIVAAASANIVYVEDFNYSYGQNAGGAAMGANGWSEIHLQQTQIPSGSVTNYGGDGYNYALWSYYDRAVKSILPSGTVTVDFTLWGGFSLAYPNYNGIAVILRNSSTNQTATFNFAGAYLWNGDNAYYSGGFRFTDGVNTYASPAGYHMGLIGYTAWTPRAAQIVYDGPNNVVSMKYHQTTIFTATLNTDYVFDQVIFSSWYQTNQGSNPSGYNGPWVIDDLTITIPEPATVILLGAGGLASVALRKRS